MELYKGGKDYELFLFKTVYQYLCDHRLTSKVTCMMEGKPEQFDAYLVGPFIFGFASKPSNLQLLIYTPHYCTQLDKQNSVLIFSPISAFLKNQIILKVDDGNAKAWYKSIIEARHFLLIITPQQVPPVSIIAKYFNTTKQTSETVDLNIFGSEITLRIPSEPVIKFSMEKQNLVAVTASESPLIPRESFFYSFAIAFRKMPDCFIVCPSLDQFVFAFVSLDINIMLHSRKKQKSMWKLSNPFLKSTQLVDNFSLVSDLKDPITNVSFSANTERMKPSIKIPEAASTKLKVIDVDSAKRTVIVASRQSENNNNNMNYGIRDKVFVENVIPDVQEDAFDKAIEELRETITVTEDPKINLKKESRQKEFMSQSGEELANVMYFRPIADPKLLFICQKIGINFTNPVFSINGEEELKLLRKQTNIRDLSICIASMLVNGAQEEIVVSKIPVICEKEEKLMACFPSSDLPAFTILTIFISRLCHNEHIVHFINLFSSATMIRKTIYRDDAICSSALFLELLAKTVAEKLPFTSRNTTNEQVFPLPFARRERFEYLVRSCALKAKNDPTNESVIAELIFHVVQFFAQGLESGSDIWKLFEVCCKSKEQFDGKQMMCAAEKFVSPMNKSSIGKFANVILVGLQCGQLYLWVLFIGRIAKNSNFYKSSSPALVTENIVIVADSLYKLVNIMFDVDSKCLNRYPQLQ